MFQSRSWRLREPCSAWVTPPPVPSSSTTRIIGIISSSSSRTQPAS